MKIQARRRWIPITSGEKWLLAIGGALYLLVLITSAAGH